MNNSKKYSYVKSTKIKTYTNRNRRTKGMIAKAILKTNLTMILNYIYYLFI